MKVLLLAAVQLVIAPETVYECAPGSGNGRVTLSWSGAGGPVEVRAGSPQGPSMTGLVPPAGSAESGDWVSDGMRFFLVNARGQVEASAQSRIRCFGGGATAASASFLPLAVGNAWVYRLNTRVSTGTYVTRTVTGDETMGGRTYFLLSESGQRPQRLREDESGRIWQLGEDADETLYLDPASAALQTIETPLTREVRTYARGLGLVRSTTSLRSGSSGGFATGYELVEARLDGGVSLRTQTAAITLSVEDTVLDVTNRRVPNCAVPSYCVGCSIFADPPGTYKPCARVRAETAALPLPHTLRLELRDSATDTVVWRSEGDGPGVRHERLMIGGFPPGAYRLAAEARTAGGEVAATSVLPVRIQ